MYLRKLLLVTALVCSSALPALAQFNDPLLDGELRSRQRQSQQVNGNSDAELDCFINGVNCPSSNNSSVNPVIIIITLILLGNVIALTVKSIILAEEERVAKEKAAKNDEAKQ